MGVHQLVLVLSQIIFLLLPFKASAISCPSRCGNVSFSYPLGIGAGCYLEKGFEVTCDNSSGSEKPFLTGISLEILGVSYTPSYAIGVNLSKISLNNISTTRGIDLSRSPFSFSNVGNNFISVGCYSNQSHNQTDSTSSGCHSFCTCDPSQNASGCCDMICTLPPNGKFNNTESISEFYSKNIPRNCSSAFMVDQQWLQSNYLTEPSVLKGKEFIPASLEWGRYRGLCVEMYNSGSTSCNDDGDCLIKLSSGYICVCNDQKSDRHQGCRGYLFCDSKSGYNCTAECPHGYNVSIYTQNSQETLCSPLRSYEDIWIKKSRVRFFTIIKGEKEEIMTVANLTKRCLNLNGKKRPTMREVAIELAGNIRVPNGALLEQQKYEEIDFVDSEITGHSATGSSLRFCIHGPRRFWFSLEVIQENVPVVITSPGVNSSKTVVNNVPLGNLGQLFQSFASGFNVPPTFENFSSTRRKIHAVVSKLLLSASVYFIWQERKFRLFKGEVHLRLHTLNFKDTPRVRHVVSDWHLPMECIKGDNHDNRSNLMSFQRNRLTNQSIMRSNHYLLPTINLGVCLCFMIGVVEVEGSIWVDYVDVGNWVSGLTASPFVLAAKSTGEWSSLDTKEAWTFNLRALQNFGKA
ncbi:hypothetical protein Patl1_24548 [Pistacia atlantica]|uniref:Uncharacterized protein n=1 Tax=Pistacia atlantica TaxID=434234 RepID=A0ACC0ZV18_9ROSI|nr:hypothetical protein Patl1_24548 [Pistacia atlantica]